MITASKGEAEFQKKRSSIREVATNLQGRSPKSKKQLITQRDTALDLQVQRLRDHTSRRIVGAEHMESTGDIWNSPMINLEVCYHISD